MSEKEIIEQMLREIEELKVEVRRLETVRPMYEAIHPDSTTRTLGASVNDYDIGNYDWIIVNTTAPRNVSGFTGGILGRRLWVTNFGSTLTVLHESALSVATNRILTLGGASKVLASGDGAMFLYVNTAVGNRWRLIFPSS